MGSPTFALFLRALRVDVRLLPSHILRLAMLAFVLVMLLWTHGISATFGAPGLVFFTQLSFINFVVATLAGPLLFATCITEEKEEQTLGLLRMANVGPLSIMLGKLAPRLASALLILPVQFPFTLLAITLGGVKWSQVLAVFWTLLAHTFLVAKVGLLCSVLSRRTGGAAARTLILLLSYLIVPVVLVEVFTSTTPPPGAAASPDWLAQWIVHWHPVGLAWAEEWLHTTAPWQLYSILKTSFVGGTFGSAQVVSNLTAGTVLFLMGWLLFDVANRNVDAAISGGGFLACWLKRGKIQNGRAWRTAIIGREFQFGNGGMHVWLVKLLLYGPLAYLAMALMERGFSRVRWDQFGALLMLLMLCISLPFETVILASRLYRTEIKDRTWSSLCMLPRSLPALAYGKLAGASLSLIPTVLYFMMGAALNPVDFWYYCPALSDGRSLVSVFTLFAHGLLLLHLVAWYSLLTNSWVGILLAFLTSFGGLWAWYLCLYAPLFLRLVPGGMSQENDLIMSAVINCLILVVTALLHWNTGHRLNLAAAD